MGWNGHEWIRNPLVQVHAMLIIVTWLLHLRQYYHLDCCLYLVEHEARMRKCSPTCMPSISVRIVVHSQRLAPPKVSYSQLDGLDSLEWCEWRMGDASLPRGKGSIKRAAASWALYTILTSAWYCAVWIIITVGHKAIQWHGSIFVYGGEATPIVHMLDTGMIWNALVHGISSF